VGGRSPARAAAGAQVSADDAPPRQVEERRDVLRVRFRVQGNRVAAVSVPQPPAPIALSRPGRLADARNPPSVTVAFLLSLHDVPATCADLASPIMNRMRDVPNAADGCRAQPGAVDAGQSGAADPGTEWYVSHPAQPPPSLASSSLEPGHGESCPARNLIAVTSRLPWRAPCTGRNWTVRLTALADPATWERSLDGSGSRPRLRHVAALTSRRWCCNGWDQSPPPRARRTHGQRAAAARCDAGCRGERLLFPPSTRGSPTRSSTAVRVGASPNAQCSRYPIRPRPRLTPAPGA